MSKSVLDKNAYLLRTHRQNQAKSTALPPLSDYFNAAAQQSCQPATNGQSQTGPFVDPSQTCVQLGKGLKDGIQVFLQNAASGIVNLKTKDGLALLGRRSSENW